MRFLGTRPEPDATKMAERLCELGHQVLVQPMTRINFLAEPADLTVPAAIVVTSRNAVRALNRWPAARAWRDVTVYAVGGATAASARDSGFVDVNIGAGDVTALADMVRGGLDRAAGPILYPTARDRSADLVGMPDGYTVLTVEAYRGVAATRLDNAVVAAAKVGALDGVVFLSRRTAAIFVNLVNAAGVAGGLRGTRFFALSAAVAEPLADLKPAKILVAARPEESSLVALIARPE